MNSDVNEIEIDFEVIKFNFLESQEMMTDKMYDTIKNVNGKISINLKNRL